MFRLPHSGGGRAKPFLRTYLNPCQCYGQSKSLAHQQTGPCPPDCRPLIWTDSQNSSGWVQLILRSRVLEMSEENPCAVDMLGNVQLQSEAMHCCRSTSGGGCTSGGPAERVSLAELLASFKVPHQWPDSVENSITHILTKCRKEKDHAGARRVHAYMRISGFETHPVLGNHLVPMLVEVGSITDAQQVFDRLVHRKSCSWNALMKGYLTSGMTKSALSVYQKMQEEDDKLSPSPYTLAGLLKFCADLKDLETGSKIHADIAKKGLLEKDVYLASIVVSMYTKCASIAKVQEVFDKLPVRDVVSWNALIAGCIQHGNGQQALNCFRRMQLEGVHPDGVTFACALKACGSIGAIDLGRELHAEIANKGLLQGDVVVGTTLVDMYAKCGCLSKAQEVFDKLPVRDVVSWNVLITGYNQHMHFDEALKCYERMQDEGVSSDTVTLMKILKACSNMRAIDKGQEIHADISRRGTLERGPLVGTALIDMYAKCGLLEKAQEVFDKLTVRNIVSWNALITGYAQHGCYKEALDCFDQMHLQGFSPDAVAFISILKACGSVGAADKGQEIHAEIARKGLLGRDLVVGNALVDMYAKCGLLAKAQEVFDKLVVHDTVSWTALITGYAQHGHGEKALSCFEQMLLKGLSPDAVTFVCILKACSGIGAIEKAQQIHSEILRRGMLQENIIVGNALVDMYVKCGRLEKAQEVLDSLPVRDVVSWNALIRGYAQQNRGKEALNSFERMQLEGVSPNDSTFVCTLKACGLLGAANKGQEIHAEIARQRLLGKYIVVGNALVDMYAKCNLIAKAQEVFDELPIRDVVSWTALIAGYSQDGQGEKALACYDRMQLEGVSPNSVTIVCCLKACGGLGATDKGGELHVEISRRGLLSKDLAVGNALIDMYAKFGWLVKAQEVFDELPAHDIVSWTALIAGYAHLGEVENVFRIFDRMIGEGFKPDLAAFTSVLHACSHAGLVEKGEMYFESMGKDYGLLPTREHFTCIVDLFGRAGQLDKLIKMIKKMPFHSNIVVWHAVLGACRKCGNVELARLAFEHAVSLDEEEPATYVSMCNIYSDAGMHEDAIKVEAMMERMCAGAMNF